MTQIQFLHDLGEVLGNLTFFVSVLFPVMIVPFWKWWASTWGWNIVLLEMCIAGALAVGIARLDLGIKPGLGLEWFETVNFALIPVIILWRGYIIYKTQRDGVLHERLAKTQNQEKSSNGV